MSNTLQTLSTGSELAQAAGGEALVFPFFVSPSRCVGDVLERIVQVRYHDLYQVNGCLSTCSHGCGQFHPINIYIVYEYVFIYTYIHPRNPKAINKNNSPKTIFLLGNFNHPKLWLLLLNLKGLGLPNSPSKYLPTYISHVCGHFLTNTYRYGI